MNDLCAGVDLRVVDLPRIGRDRAIQSEPKYKACVQAPLLVADAVTGGHDEVCAIKNPEQKAAVGWL